MKKVFSKEKFIEDMEKNNEGKYYSWWDECDGLTEEEMFKLGYGTNEDWMIEIEGDENNE